MKTNVLNWSILSLILIVSACTGNKSRVASAPSESAQTSPTEVATQATPGPTVIPEPETTPTPTPTPVPTPTPTPVKTFVTQTSLGETVLNVYPGIPPKSAGTFGMLSMTEETVTHTPGGDGVPVANDSTTTLPSSYPIYLDSVSLEGVSLSLYPGDDTIQKLVNPVISDIHSEFKIPKTVCDHFVGVSGGGSGSFGGSTPVITTRITCHYSAAGILGTCTDDSIGKVDNFYPGDGTHPEFYCDRSIVIYPNSQTVEDFVKLKTLLIQVFEDEHDFLVPRFNQNTGAEMPDQTLHLNEDQVQFTF